MTLSFEATIDSSHRDHAETVQASNSWFCGGGCNTFEEAQHTDIASTVLSEPDVQTWFYYLLTRQVSET